MSRIRSDRVCFTLNNYEEEDLSKITAMAEEPSKFDIKYIVCGEEVGESGTRHLQGFAHLDMDPKAGGIKFWKKFFEFSQAAHFENARGTDDQNRTYCTKEGIFIEGGSPQEKQASLYERVFMAAKTSVEEAVAIDFEIGLRYYSQLNQIFANHNKQAPTTSIETLREWQKETIEDLKAQSDREILFIVDYEGGKGKSALTKYMMVNFKAWACQGKLL